jgi:uncharacterized repeat protein (TIGR03803 family)
MNRFAGYGVALALAFLTAVSAAAAAAQESVLYRFRGGRDGGSPNGGLIADAKGVLYGTTENDTVFALAPPAARETRWTETVLYTFRDSPDGIQPHAGLIADAKGVLYGTTAYGGDNGWGTVFALAPPGAGETRWTETVLYSFRGGRDGSIPEAGLMADANGVLYGTTIAGGDTSCVNGGCGTVFALAPPAAGETRWTETVLHRFRGRRDGLSPHAGLIADANGVLYGTTELGGGNTPRCPDACGTVFALAPPATGETGWTETVLHRFRGRRDGSSPSGLIADAKGVLYGTTYAGGGTSCFPRFPPGCGTVFALSPPAAGGTRWTETVLHSFRGDPDGRNPSAGLIADAKGVLYGTTDTGGGVRRFGDGTVFALSPPAAGVTGWKETVLYSFRGVRRRDGSSPSGLIADAKGVLYGTTYAGGINSTSCDRRYGCGTVFALSPAGGGWDPVK